MRFEDYEALANVLTVFKGKKTKCNYDSNAYLSSLLKIIL